MPQSEPIRSIKNRLRLGIIGCGAVVSQSYLPSLRDSRLFRLEALVDKNEPLLKELSEQYKVPHHFKDYRDCMDIIDAALVALPHHLHAEVTVELLEHGIHVLCEKPMALRYSQCENMLRAAGQSILSVSSVRKFYWSSRKVKDIIKNGQLGELHSVNWEEGSPYAWPTASGFYFDAKQAGGGVTMDTGYYILDMLLWWLGQYPREIDYMDDNFGGVEAESEINLQFSDALAAKIRMSRLVPLKNVCELQFEKGKVTYFTGNFNSILVSEKDVPKHINSPRKKPLLAYFGDMMEDFGLSILDNRQPFADPKQSALVTKLINECYQARKELVQPWLIIP
jgi:predicted dehydrogenase